MNTLEKEKKRKGVSCLSSDKNCFVYDRAVGEEMAKEELQRIDTKLRVYWTAGSVHRHQNPFCRSRPGDIQSGTEPGVPSGCHLRHKTGTEWFVPVIQELWSAGERIAVSSGPAWSAVSEYQSTT